MEPAKAVVAAFVEAFERLGGILEMGRQIARRTTQVFLRQFTSSRRISFDSDAYGFRFTLLVQFFNSKPVVRDG